MNVIPFTCLIGGVLSAPRERERKGKRKLFLAAAPHTSHLYMCNGSSAGDVASGYIPFVLLDTPGKRWAALVSLEKCAQRARSRRKEGKTRRFNRSTRSHVVTRRTTSGLVFP